MISKALWLIAVVVCALLAIPASCAGTRVLAESEQAQIYSAVIQRLRAEHGGPATGYIMGYTDDSGGIEPARPGSKVLPESLRDAIATALADSFGKYIWADNFSEVPHDQYFAGDYCQIILGNIQLQEDGSLHVAGSLFYGGTGGGGAVWVLKRQNGAWTVTGTTGRVWIS